MNTYSPDWLLRKYGLHNRKIVLPNGVSQSYGTYKLPCCAACNSFLGKKIETPVSRLIEGGYEAVREHMLRPVGNLSFDGGPWLLFVWMALVFLKLHLKDQSLRLAVGHEAMTERIGDLHRWSDLHHIHCIVRSAFTHTAVEPSSLGSFLVLPARTDEGRELFDFRSHTVLGVMSVRFGDFVVIACLDDAGLGLDLMRSRLDKIRAPLSVLQQREVLALLGYFNHSLPQRPTFRSEVDAFSGEITITADVPRVRFEDDAAKRGEIMYQLALDILDKLDVPEIEELRVQIRTGLWSFLTDGDGNFIHS